MKMNEKNMNITSGFASGGLIALIQNFSKFKS